MSNTALVDGGGVRAARGFHHGLLVLGILPSALLGSALTVVPNAHADDYQNCEDARVEYCYGEGNALLDCYDHANEKEQLACIRRGVRLCETVLVKACEKLPGAPSTGAGQVSYAADCPPGTAPDELGRCVARLQQREDGPDLDPNDWCPPGTVVGPLDDCIPAISTVRVMPNAGGGWGIVCPPGTKPGPIDGCVLDTGIGGEDGEQSPISCPPGTAPGPDDSCVPLVLTMNLGNIDGMLAMDALTKSGALEQQPYEAEALLSAIGVKTVGDPAAALEATAEALGAELVDPGEPGSW